MYSPISISSYLFLLIKFALWTGLGIQFPRADLELEKQAPIVDEEEHFPVETPSPSETEKGTKGYASCYSAIMKKGLSMGYTADYIISAYRSNLDQAMDNHLRSAGHAVAQFNGEMRWWRYLCTPPPSLSLG
jgi:hypothetical protein